MIKLKIRSKGFGPAHDVGFWETLAPTAEAAGVKIAVAVANEKYCLFRHLDINQVIVQSHSDEGVYMTLSFGCGGTSGVIVLLPLTVYRLQEAGRQWSLRLSGVFRQRIE